MVEGLCLFCQSVKTMTSVTRTMTTKLGLVVHIGPCEGCGNEINDLDMESPPESPV